MPTSPNGLVTDITGTSITAMQSEYKYDNGLHLQGATSLVSESLCVLAMATGLDKQNISA